VPSQKCWVSGVGLGFARAGSAISFLSSRSSWNLWCDICPLAVNGRSSRSACRLFRHPHNGWGWTACVARMARV